MADGLWKSGVLHPRLCEVNRKLNRDPRTPLLLYTPSPLVESVSIDILGALLGSRLQIAVNTCS